MANFWDNIYFIYSNQNGKIYPQKCYGDRINPTTGKLIKNEKAILLKDNEFNLTLQELSEKYPYQEPKT